MIISHWLTIQEKHIEGKIIKTWGKKQEVIPQIDAFAARTALRDSCVAHADLKTALKEENNQRIRMAWIACLTHLRAVGHVLQKVDSSRSIWIKQASDEAFLECKLDRFSHTVFWEFIEVERNSLLKEYSSKIFDKVSDVDNPKKKTIIVTNILIGTELYSPCEAVGAAIQWWEKYLENVETKAAVLRSGKVLNKI